MKVSFVLIAFNSDHVLEPCLRSVLPFGQVYAAEGPVQFWQNRGYSKSTDDTCKILDDYMIPVIHGAWREKDDEQNAALSLVPGDTDFVFCLDCDEIWDKLVLHQIFKTLETGQVDSMSFQAVSFFGGFDRYMTGFEADFEVHRVQRFYPGCRFSTHRPPTIDASDGKPWRLHRHVFAKELKFYHYSYVFPSQVRAKAEYYAAMGGNIPNYYEAVYVPWVMGDSEEKHKIEETYNGVHNWLPARRGPCRTARFTDYHPIEILDELQALKDRLEFELAATNEC